ncbi:MAG: tRNA1(Val) (adenine(37)-N6)-methyltransferase [Christensenellales bacterium]
MKINLKDNERLDDLQFNNLYIIQEKDGYCFTSDAVMLANFVNTKSGSKIVDLCSGSGVIGILAGEKNKAGKIVLVEIQENLADMSRRTIEYNQLKNYEVINLPLQDISKKIGIGIYDVVVCNPPYKKNGTAKLINENQSIAIARHELLVTLEEIICEASKLLKFGGDFYVVNKEERLTDILVLCRKYNLEPKILKIRESVSGANIIFVKAKKGGKSGITISL